jgi:hypothetical protein
MRIHSFLVFWLALGTFAASSSAADEILIPRSDSPNHKYAIYAIDPRDPAAVAHLEVREKATGKPVYGLGASGWVETAAGLALTVNTTVLWTRDSHQFALKLRGTKTSSEVSVYKVIDGNFSEIPLPNLLQRVQQEAHVNEGRFFFESPVKWRGKNFLVIKAVGNTVDWNDPDGEYEYEYNLTVDLQNDEIAQVDRVKAALPPPTNRN